MTELKTLKDLENKYWVDDTGIPLIAVDIPTLKAEATKWIEAKRDAMGDYDGCEYGTKAWFSRESLKADIFFIKTFFNIRGGEDDKMGD